MSMKSMKKVFALGIALVVGMFGMLQHSFAATPNFTVSNITSTTATVNFVGLNPNASYSVNLSHEGNAWSQQFVCNTTQNCSTNSNYAISLASLLPNTDYSVKLSDSTGAMLVSHFFSTPSGGQSNPVSLTAVVSSITNNSARIDVTITGGAVPDGLDVLYGVSQDTSSMAHDETMNENSDGTYDLTLNSLLSCRTYYYAIQDSENSSTFYTSVKSFQTAGCGNNQSITITPVNITSTTVRFQASGLTVGSTYHIFYYNQNSNNSVGSVNLNSVSSAAVTTAPVSLAPNTYIAKLFNDTDLNSIATTSQFVITGGTTTGGGSGGTSGGGTTTGGSTSGTALGSSTTGGGTTGGTTTGGTSGSTTTGGTTIEKLQNPLGDDNNSIPEILVTIVDNVILPIAIPFVALAIIWTGFQFVLARGNTTKLADAKKSLWWTLLGAGVILGAYVIAQVVQSTVEEIRGTQTGMSQDSDHHHFV